MKIEVAEKRSNVFISLGLEYKKQKNDRRSFLAISIGPQKNMLVSASAADGKHDIRPYLV